MREQFNISTPNLKIRIKNVRYQRSGNQVHCFITMEDLPYEDAYHKLMDVAFSLGMKNATHCQYKFNRGWKSGKNSGSDSYIYNPTHYEYHGVATYKNGDIEDFKLAETIAYKKAYRQLVNFYWNCYNNLYNYVTSYASDVWLEQIAQMSDRYLDVDREIHEAIKN